MSGAAVELSGSALRGAPELWSRSRCRSGICGKAAGVLDLSWMVAGGRRVVFLPSDNVPAVTEIGALADDLGFAPIKPRRTV